MFRLLLIVAAATSSLAFNAGAPLAPQSVTTASRAAVFATAAPKYKRKSYIERLKGPTPDSVGRKAAQNKREAAAAAVVAAEAAAKAAEEAAAAAEAAEAAAAAAAEAAEAEAAAAAEAAPAEEEAPAAE